MGPVYFVIGFALLVLSVRFAESGHELQAVVCVVSAPVFFWKSIKWVTRSAS